MAGVSPSRRLRDVRGRRVAVEDRILKVPALVLAMLAVSVGCNSDSSIEPPILPPVPPPTVPGDIRGLWQWQETSNSCTAIQTDTSGVTFVGITLSDRDCPCCPGERVFECRWDSTRRVFSGRHLWGGCGYDTMFWGADGGLEITQHGRDSLRLSFKDSCQDCKWWLVRTEACDDRERPEATSGLLPAARLAVGTSRLLPIREAEVP
jgi:hypothetical protein